MFKTEIASGFGEPGGTPLQRIPRSTPQGGGGLVTLHHDCKKLVNVRMPSSAVIEFWMQLRKCSVAKSDFRLPTPTPTSNFGLRTSDFGLPTSFDLFRDPRMWSSQEVLKWMRR